MPRLANGADKVPSTVSLVNLFLIIKVYVMCNKLIVYQLADEENIGVIMIMVYTVDGIYIIPWFIIYHAHHCSSIWHEIYDRDIL